MSWKYALMHAIEVQVKELMDAKERIGTLEDALELKEHTIRSLERKLEQFQAEDKGAVMQKPTDNNSSDILSHFWNTCVICQWLMNRHARTAAFIAFFSIF